MIHPSTCVRYINSEIGHGVFATQFIPKGTILWVKDSLDRTFTEEQIEELPEIQKNGILNHSYRNNKGHFVFCWDHTRYVNHSFFPNSLLTPYGFELAVDDIKTDDQITNDYGTLNIIEPFEPIGPTKDRNMVMPDDLKTYGPIWDQILKETFPLIESNDQPLWDLLSSEQQHEIKNYTTHGQVLRSMVELWFENSLLKS